MTGLTDRDAQALTYLACRIRKEVPGARKWDEAGTHAEIVKMLGQNLPIVVERVTRHAGDVDAKTPGAIRRPFIPAAAVAGPPSPPRPHEACRDCGRHFDSCLCDGGPKTRKPEQIPDPTPIVDRLRAVIAETTAEFCSHGVDRRMCIDHRERKTSSTAATEGNPA